MEAGAEPTAMVGARGAEGPRRTREGLPFWGLWAFLTLEAALFVVTGLVIDIGTGFVAAAAGLFVSGAISMLSLSLTDSPSGIAVRRPNAHGVDMRNASRVHAARLSSCEKCTDSA